MSTHHAPTLVPTALALAADPAAGGSPWWAARVTYYLAVTRPDVLVSQDCVQDGVTMKCGETDSDRAP